MTTGLAVVLVVGQTVARLTLTNFRIDTMTIDAGLLTGGLASGIFSQLVTIVTSA